MNPEDVSGTVDALQQEADVSDSQEAPENISTSSSSSDSLSQSIMQTLGGGKGPTDEAVARTDAATSKVQGAQRRVLDAGKAQTSAIDAEAGLETKAADSKRLSDLELLSHQSIIEGQRKQVQAKYDEAVAARADFRATTLGLLQKQNDLGKQIAAQPMHDFWDNKSPVLHGALTALSAIGAFFQGAGVIDHNAIADTIETGMKRDLMMQRLRLDKNQQDFANQNLLVNQFMKAGDDMEDASDRAYSTGLDAVAARLTMLKNSTSDKRIQGEYDKQIALIAQKSQAAKGKLLEQTAGKDYAMSQAELQTAVARERIEQTHAPVAKDILAEKRLRLQQDKFADKQQEEDRSKTTGITDASTLFPDATRAKQFQKAHEVALPVVRNLLKLAKLTENAKLTLSDQTEMSQLSSQIALVAKGESGFNLGAALTPSEQALMVNALGTGDVNRVLKVLGKEKLLRAARMMTEQYNDKLIANGVRPNAKNELISPELFDRLNAAKKKAK